MGRAGGDPDVASETGEAKTGLARILAKDTGERWREVGGKEPSALPTVLYLLVFRPAPLEVPPVGDFTPSTPLMSVSLLMMLLPLLATPLEALPVLLFSELLREEGPLSPEDLVEYLPVMDRDPRDEHPEELAADVLLEKVVTPEPARLAQQGEKNEPQT